MLRLGRRAFLRIAAASALVRPRSAAAGEPPGARAVHRATCQTWHGPSALSAWFTKRPAPSKLYPGAPRTALPSAGPHAGAPLGEAVRLAATNTGSGRPISLALLARLLHLTNGVTGTIVGSDPPEYRRAAPSAGALYAGEVYVAAENVDGLAPGLYAYVTPEHALASLCSGAVLGEVAAALEANDAVSGAAAAVVLTNVFGRYAWRYGPRGYRFALIDSGHIGENLRLAAAAYGLGCASPLRFHDDALNDLLGIDGREEAVCALHVVGGAGSARAAPARRTLVERGAADPSLDEVERYHEATKLVPGSPPLPEAAAAPGRAAPPPGAEAVLPLPVSPAPTLAVTSAIHQRRSARGFEERAIGLEALALALDQAESPGLGLCVVVHRVLGLEPGLYESQPTARALRLLRAGSLEGALVRACLFQEKAGSAAVAFAWVADLGADAGAGERGYRDQLLAAGAAAQRVYLAAESLGLAARNLAAFFDDSLDDLLGLDGRERAVIHLTLLGHESEAATLGP